MIVSKTQVRRGFLICLLLVIGITAAYGPVTGFGFINFDDRVMVLENKRVQAGINFENLVWAFKISDLTYWHPLTWLSHMLDCHLFGLNAGFHHFTNLIFHISNTLLLFIILNRMTGAIWRSAFVAGLFALHPVNIETVAWIASRKTLVCTFFWLLTLGSYLLFLERKSTGFYVLMMIFFSLGLMAKPMPVTLPFTLLLLDYWPLGRYSRGGLPEMNQKFDVLRILFQRIVEKIPLFVLTALSLYISFQSVNAVVPTEAVPLTIRISNSIVSYVRYLEKWIMPWNLSIFYPFPAFIAHWRVLASILLLVIISVYALFQAGRRPYFIIGWLWFVGTLVPVIGLVQWDLWPAMADRFAYIPYIGLFMALSWGGGGLAKEIPKLKKSLSIGACSILGVLLIMTSWQLPNWRNSRSIFENALHTTENNYIAYYGLAIAYSRQEETRDTAIDYYREALRINPGFVKAYLNLGAALERSGRFDEAARYFQHGLEIDPDYAELHNNLAGLYFARKQYEAARSHLERALRIAPGYANAHYNLANVLTALGKESEAISHYRLAIQYDPDHAMGHYRLGELLMGKKAYALALREFAETIRSDPAYHLAYYQIGMILLQQGKPDKALVFVEKALDIDPTFKAAQEAAEAISGSGMSSAHKTD